MKTQDKIKDLIYQYKKENEITDSETVYQCNREFIDDLKTLLKTECNHENKEFKS